MQESSGEWLVSCRLGVSPLTMPRKEMRADGWKHVKHRGRVTNTREYEHESNRRKSGRDIAGVVSRAGRKSAAG